MALESIFAALILTLVIELAVALVYSRDRRLLLAAALVNIVTNPLLNIFLYFFQRAVRQFNGTNPAH